MGSNPFDGRVDAGRPVGRVGGGSGLGPRGRTRRLATSVAIVIASAFVLLAACDSLFTKRSPGEALWRSRCATCHGIDGRGNTAQYMGNYKADLIDNTWSHGPDPGAWEVVIREGVFGSMPANPDLDDEQVKALIQYLRQLRGEAQYR